MFLSFIVIKREHCTACQIAEEEEKRIGQELKPAGAHILMVIKLLGVREVPAHTHPPLSYHRCFWRYKKILLTHTLSTSNE